MEDLGSQTNGNNKMQHLRSYSASCATTQPPSPPKELKKGRSINSSVSKALCFGDPELQRKKRVANYKVYSAEGKMKGSFKKSLKWVKERYSQIVHEWK